MDERRSAMLILLNRAPVAQLDRASGYEPEGREFESPRARHFFVPLLSIRFSDARHTFRTPVGEWLGGREAPNRTIGRNHGTGERKFVRATGAQGADPSSCR